MSGSEDVRRYFREMPPAHYTLEIESLSELQQIMSKTYAKSFESQIFEAGGYKWKLDLYPKGLDEENGGHISMVLVIAETEALPLGWEINVEFKCFVYDQIRDIYLTIQDVKGKGRRFHQMKKEWCIAKLLSHVDFNDANNGYCIKDRCVFGVEVFVISRLGRGERLALANKYGTPFTWKIDYFSTLENILSSSSFTMGNIDWELDLYPRGDSRSKGTFLSLFLRMTDSKRAARVYADYTLTILDQLKNNNSSITGHRWFTASSKSWGSVRHTPLSELRNPSRGFIVNNSLIVEALIENIWIQKTFP